MPVCFEINQQVFRPIITITIRMRELVSGSPENKKIGFGAVGLFSHNNIGIFYVLLSLNIKI